MIRKYFLSPFQYFLVSSTIFLTIMLKIVVMMTFMVISHELLRGKVSFLSKCCCERERGKGA